MRVTSWEFESPLRHRFSWVEANSRHPLETRPGFTPWARTLTTENVGGRMVADLWVRGKSDPHRARVPGESRGGAVRRRQSRLALVWRSRRLSESNRDQAAWLHPCGVKRAILPAAISDAAVIRWLAKAGSREQPPRRRSGRSLGTERDDHLQQNSAYSPPTFSVYGAFSSIGRAPVCGTGGHGFEPRKAPQVTPSAPRQPSKVRFTQAICSCGQSR